MKLRRIKPASCAVLAATIICCGGCGGSPSNQDETAVSRRQVRQTSSANGAEGKERAQIRRETFQKVSAPQATQPPPLIRDDSARLVAEQKPRVRNATQNIAPPTTDNPTALTQHTLVADEPNERTGKNPPAEPEFEPPFGARINLFVPVENEPIGGRQGSEAATPGVQLKGFARVDRLRAVLSIAGRVVTLADGEEKEGLRAVRVAPPQVELQRGRRRWTITLGKSLESP